MSARLEQTAPRSERKILAAETNLRALIGALLSALVHAHGAGWPEAVDQLCALRDAAVKRERERSE